MSTQGTQHSALFEGLSGIKKVNMELTHDDRQADAPKPPLVAGEDAGTPYEGPWDPRTPRPQGELADRLCPDSPSGLAFWGACGGHPRALSGRGSGSCDWPGQGPGPVRLPDHAENPSADPPGAHFCCPYVPHPHPCRGEAFPESDGLAG